MKLEIFTQQTRAALRPYSAALLAVLAGCTHREPPAPTEATNVAPLPSGPLPNALSSAARATVAGDAVAPQSRTDAPDAGKEPETLGTLGGGTLPQTHDKPKASGPEWDARVGALWSAIQEDDPKRALPAFFPIYAYQQVKDVGDPSRDWRIRLIGAFDRDIHAIHAELGARAKDAHFLGIDVPDRARWVEPQEEYNRIGYFRVYGTRIRYELNGRTKEIPIKSLISWRGEWFVVHLSGFK